MRLQKVLSRSGVASRRAGEQLIREGRVQVNGQVVTAMGVQIDPRQDIVTVDGRRVDAPSQKRYIKLYKPAGYLSVVRDDRGRRALGDLVPDVQGLYPVGRLDLDSEGLVLLTDDGELTLHLTHPRYKHPKEYLVLVQGVPGQDALRALRQGVALEEAKTAPAQIELVHDAPWGPAPRGQTWLRVVLHEGRKRQVRRMLETVGHPVQRLIRIRIGPIGLGDLAPGAWRPLTEDELCDLSRAVGSSEA